MSELRLRPVEVLIVILLTANIVIMVFIAFKTGTEGAICQRDPLVYGVKKLGKLNSAEASCTCVIDRPNTESLLVTEEGLKTFNTYSSKFVDETRVFNWTLPNLSISP